MMGMRREGDLDGRLRQRFRSPAGALARAALLVALLVDGAAAAPIGWLYVNGNLGDSVSGFAVEASGSLTPLPGSPFAAGGSGGAGFYASNRAVAIVDGGVRRLYVSKQASATVSAFDIASNGALTPVSGSPFATGLTDLGALAATPDGACLFAASESGGGFARFTVAADGSLTLVGVEATSMGLDGVAVSPSGAHLVAAAPDTGILVFAVGAGCSTSVVAGSPFAVGLNTAHVEFDASGARIFTAIFNAVDTEVGVFDFIAGTPTAIAGSPFAFASGANSNVSRLRPGGDRLYVTNQDTGTVTVLDVAGSGALSLHAGSPFATGGSVPCGMDFTPDGDLLFAINGASSSVTVFSVAADGSVSAVPGSPFPAAGGGLPTSLVFVPGPCGSAPATGCLSSAGSILALKDNAGDDGKDKLLWKWIHGDALTQGQLADPMVDASYALCLYAGPTNAPIGHAILPPGSDWGAIGDKGYKFKGSTPDGLTGAVLKGGAAGRAKALVKGKGAGLPDPTLPMAYPVTVQLRQEGSPLCLESIFTSADQVKNELGQFKARQ